jgi:Protein of unknown function (DUF4199)
MLRLILLYGTIAGLIVAVPMVALMNLLTAETAPDEGALYGYLTMIVALTTVFLGIKHYRDRFLGGVITFGRALLVGLGISAVASTLYVIAWDVSLATSGFDFAAEYSNATLAAARRAGASQAELARVVADNEVFVARYANPFFRWPMTFIEIFPVGVLISLVSAGLLRNSRFLPARARA